MKMSKMIIVLFEGISNQYIFDWIDSGLLPGFKRLANEGFIDKLHCNRIPYEAAGLVTAFSGVKDSKHGILSYYQAYNREYIPEIWDSTHIKNKMIWKQKEYTDKSFNVINIFGTHPAYSINGNLISFVMKQSLHYCFPNDLIKNLSEQGLQYSQDLNGFRLNKLNDSFFNEVIRADTLRFSVVKELLKQNRDITIVNFTAIDRLSHFYMDEIENASIDDIKQSKIFRAYKMCDDILNDLIYLCYNGSNMIVFSEIGFGHLKKYININTYLGQKGYLRWNQSETHRPDWNKTIAFESVQGTSGININRQGRYIHGSVSENEYDEVCEEIIICLKNMPNPENNDPMFCDVQIANNYFENNGLTPDIILTPYNEEFLPYGDSYWSNIVSRNTQTGWHRSDSFCGGLGPGISKKVVSNPRDLTDIVPTINHLLDISMESCDGKPWVK